MRVHYKHFTIVLTVKKKMKTNKGDNELNSAEGGFEIEFSSFFVSFDTYVYE